MTDALLRRTRSALAIVLSSAMIVLSPGLSSYSAAAAEFEGPAGKSVPTPLPQINANLGKTIEIPGSAVINLTLPGALATPQSVPELPVSPAGLENPAQVATPQAGTPQAEAQNLSKLGETLAPQIEAAGNDANADPRSSGERIEALIEGRSHAEEAEAAVAESNRTGSDVLHVAELPNPSGLYAHAYPIAVAKAAALGKSPAQVHFYEAAASVPGVDGASWKFSFYLTDKESTPEQLAKNKPAVGDIVYVDFRKPGPGSRGSFQVSDDPSLDRYMQVYLGGVINTPRSFAQSYDAPSVTVFKNAPLASDWIPFTADPAYFSMGSQTSAQGALGSARRAGLDGGVSVSFKMREQPVSGDKDFWYSFHDDKGAQFLANGRTNEDRLVKTVEPETASQRLSRFTSNGKGAGVVAGLIAAAGIFHGVSHIDIGSQYGFGAYFVGMLFSPLMMLLSAVGLTALGGKIGGFLSGVKTPRVIAAPVVEAPKKIEAPKVVAAPVAPAKQEPVSYERDGSTAGEWLGGISTVVGALVAAHFSAALTAYAGLGGILIASAFPFVGIALILGGSALGAAIGRRMDRNGGKLNLGVVTNGLLAGVATLLASGAIAALTGWTWTMVVTSFAAIEAGAGFIGLIASAVKNGGHIDFKNDPLARASSVSAISGVLTGATFAALFGWLSFAIAGTLKDKAGASVKPFEQGVGAVYKEAYAAALSAATAKGYKPAQVKFAGIEALSPMDGTRGWSAQFVALKDGKSGKGELFRASLYPQKDGGLKASQAYSYGEVTINAGESLVSLTSTLSRQTKTPLSSAIKDAAKALGTHEAELALSVERADKDLWYIFDNEAGRRYGVNGRTGEGKEFTASTITRERLEAAAKSVGSYKGRPWSNTEYNMQESLTGDSLRRDGASPAQLRLFYKLCADIPVKAGGFNPWSGD